LRLISGISGNRECDPAAPQQHDYEGADDPPQQLSVPHAGTMNQDPPRGNPGPAPAAGKLAG